MSTLKKLSEALGPRGFRIPEGYRVPVGLKKRDLSIAHGEVKYVDVDRQTFTAQLFYSNTVIQDVQIAQPYAGPSSYIAAMPEKGSIVIIGSTEEAAFLIGYVPAYIHSLEQKHLKIWPDSAKARDNHRYYRIKKLRPGEVGLSSSAGSELFLGDNPSLEGPAGDSIVIRNSDNSIIQTSLSSYNFNSGIYVSSGIVQRPGLDEPNSDDDGFAYRRVLADGRITYELKQRDDNALSKYFTEYQIEASETSSAEHPTNSINESFDDGVRKAVGVLSLGNFVGNNPEKPRTYAQLLGVKLFNSSNDTDGGFELISLRGNEPERFGMAAALYAPKKENYEYGAFFGIDKEGHFYQYIPSASGGGLGSGKSMSILAQGSKKEVWGIDNNGLAWDLMLKGGFRSTIGIAQGTDDPDMIGRSIFQVCLGPAYYQYGPAKPQLNDFDDPGKVIRSVTAYKKVEKIGGKERREITGTSEELIGGSHKVRISGMKSESVNGSGSLYVGGDYNVQVATGYSLKVSGEGQEGFKEKIITCTKGGHELEIYTKGDITETIKIRGNRETLITSGDIKETIVSRGHRKFKTTSGNFEVKIRTQGDIKSQTTAGNIISKTKAGKATIDATLKAQIKTKAALDLKGNKVKIKTSTPASGAITKLSHLDYITGAPLQNSKTVSIST